MMQGTDLEWFRSLRAATTLPITAAGGITTIEDVKSLMSMGIHSAMGMAIYTGHVKLDDLRQLL
jgi:phosphoribosylformimino-5-aminoimidazole carboxamide ribonucleotide (ProFAR) isomerase